MAFASKFKTLGTGLLATKSKWIKWPKRQLVLAEERTSELTQVRVPLWSYTTDRILIAGSPSTASVTAQGVFELWKKQSKYLAESESMTTTESSTVCRTLKLVAVLGGAAGIYLIVRWHRNRKLSAAVQSNIALQQAIVQGVQNAVLQGIKDPLIQAAENAIEKAYQSVQNVHLQALKIAVGQAYQEAQNFNVQAIKEAVGQAFQEAHNVHAEDVQDVSPVPSQNLTTKMVIKAFLAAGNGQEIDLKAFLDSMGLDEYLLRLQTEGVLNVEDLSRCSEEQLAGYDIQQ